MKTKIYLLIYFLILTVSISLAQHKDDLFFLRKADGNNKFILKDPGNIDAWTSASYSFGNSDVSNFDFVVTGDFNNDDRTDLFFLNKNNGNNKFILKDPGNIDAWTSASYSFGNSDVSNFDFVIVGDFYVDPTNFLNITSENDIRVYPNLIQDENIINVELKGETLYRDWLVTLRSLNGSEISSRNILSGNKFNQFHINELPKGVYFLTFFTSDFSLTKKIVIQ